MQFWLCYAVGMKLKKQIIINTDCLKEKKFENVADFVRWAWQVNGSDYETIQQQMASVMQFANNNDLSEIKEIYQALFVGNTKVSNLQFLPDECAIKFENQNFTENEAACKVVVQKGIDQSGMMLKLMGKTTMTNGHEKEDLTTLNFSDNHLTLESKYSIDLGQKFDKQNLSYNNYARDQVNYEFGFDETNQITQYSYYRCSSESANWNRSQMMDMVKNRNQTGMTR